MFTFYISAFRTVVKIYQIKNFIMYDLQEPHLIITFYKTTNLASKSIQYLRNLQTFTFVHNKVKFNKFITFRINFKFIIILNLLIFLGFS